MFAILAIAVFRLAQVGNQLQVLESRLARIEEGLASNS
jgi:hypothetical protein